MAAKKMGRGLRLADAGARLKGEIERAENTVVLGANQLQGLAGSTQTKLKETLTQAQGAISGVSALPLNAREHVQASIDRVSRQIALESEPDDQDAALDQAWGDRNRSPDPENAGVDAIRPDAV
jgi:hypothetical protein